MSRNRKSSVFLEPEVVGSCRGIVGATAAPPFSTSTVSRSLISHPNGTRLKLAVALPFSDELIPWREGPASAIPRRCWNIKRGNQPRTIDVLWVSCGTHCRQGHLETCKPTLEQIEMTVRLLNAATVGRQERYVYHDERDAPRVPSPERHAARFYRENLI